MNLRKNDEKDPKKKHGNDVHNLTQLEAEIKTLTDGLGALSIPIGNWTPGISFGNGTVGIIYTFQNGFYSKIGKLVYVTGRIELASKGSSTGTVRITGLPFTIKNDLSAQPIPSLRLNYVTFANQFMGVGAFNSTYVMLVELTEAGVSTYLDDTNFANNSVVAISMTYLVD
jgi:hypothetical protein